MPRNFVIVFVLLVALISNPAASSQDLPPLPSPLTLDDALAFADVSHPDLELAGARLDQAAAGLADAVSTTGTRVSALGRLGVVDPSHRSLDSDNDDHFARLLVSKRLYDFGYSSAFTAAAELQVSSLEKEYLDARQQRDINRPDLSTDFRPTWPG